MRSRSRRPFRVAIIGSGFGGIATAVKLQKSTSASFVIFEQAAGVGGTWFENRYPGCEVDIPSHAYSFSFLKYDWARTHATQPELLKYAEHVVDTFDLRPHLRLNTRVTTAEWDDTRQVYDVSTDRGEILEFDAVVSAVGLLSVPRFPDWPGLDEFSGVAFHTSRWEPDHDLTDKTVAIVGTGSTAAQIVPALAPSVGKLLVYQREPGWVEPKSEREFTQRERAFYRHVPYAQRIHRLYLFTRGARRFKAYDAASKKQRQMRAMCEAYIKSAIDDPAIQAAVTPDYPWGCKRPVVASTYYPTFNRSNVELVPHAVVRATPGGLVDATGTERDVDVLVMSTGFQPTKFLANIEIAGRKGARLHDVWEKRASAFLGVTVPDFPNFFVLYGPNTNGGMSIIAQLERQAEIAVSSIARLQKDGLRAVDTHAGAARSYVRWIDKQLARHASAMNSGCHNYFHTAGGDNVTQWPRTHFVYFVVTRVLRRRGLRFS